MTKKKIINNQIRRRRRTSRPIATDEKSIPPPQKFENQITLKFRITTQSSQILRIFHIFEFQKSGPENDEVLNYEVFVKISNIFMIGKKKEKVRTPA